MRFLRMLMAFGLVCACFVNPASAACINPWSSCATQVDLLTTVLNAVNGTAIDTYYQGELFRSQGRSCDFVIQTRGPGIHVAMQLYLTAQGTTAGGTPTFDIAIAVPDIDISGSKLEYQGDMTNCQWLPVDIDYGHIYDVEYRLGAEVCTADNGEPEVVFSNSYITVGSIDVEGLPRNVEAVLQAAFSTIFRELLNAMLKNTIEYYLGYTSPWLCSAQDLYTLSVPTCDNTLDVSSGALRLSLEPGFHSIQLEESTINLQGGDPDYDLEKVMVATQTPGDPSGWFWTLPTGSTLDLELAGLTATPLYAFIPVGATGSNTGSAHFSIDGVPQTLDAAHHSLDLSNMPGSLSLPYGDYQVAVVSSANLNNYEQGHRVGKVGLFAPTPGASDGWFKVVSEGGLDRLTIGPAGAEGTGAVHGFIVDDTPEDNVGAVTVFLFRAPRVTVTAADPDASEQGDDIGTFVVERSDCSDMPLVVEFEVSGTASKIRDYRWISNRVTIEQNECSAGIRVVPRSDRKVEESETVTVTILESPGYLVGSPSTATVTIADGN